MKTNIGVLLTIACAFSLSQGCTDYEHDCNFLHSCTPPTGGASPDAGTGGHTTTATGGATVGGTTGIGGVATGGNSSIGGLGTGGIPSACDPVCTGSKPVCNESAKACVECLSDGNCAAAKPACNTATNACVACTQDTHCSGITPACNTATNACVACTDDKHCSGATPACNTASNTCVACTKDAHCGGATPLCDTAKQQCVQCLDNSDCSMASASLCLAGTCSPCATHADCSHITGKTVCKTDGESAADAGATTGTCVECTGTDYQACSDGDAGTGRVCDSLKNTCSDKLEHSAGLCQTCVSDAQCAPGELCAEQIFNGKSVGYFCLYKQGDTANGAPVDCTLTGRPYVKAQKTTSIDGELADLCTLRSSTCPALNQFSSKSCDSGSGTPSDQLCGTAPGVDSKCTAYGTTQYRCTVTCLSDDDCRSGVTCNTAVNPPICNLQ